MTVGELLVATFTLSRAANPELGQRWLKTSYCAGSLLPNSLLLVTVQRLGEIDTVCRAMEGELLANPPNEGQMDFRDNYYALMAEVWIGSAYSVCYILNHRKLITTSDFVVLANDLRTVRVQLEKYEIPSDNGLKEPLAMTRSPMRDDETEAPIYLYDRRDAKRAHIGRMGISSRRSLMWETIEVQTHTSRWLERLELSDRFLNVFEKIRAERLKQG